MKYSTFEELPVWKAAIQFALRVFEFTNKAEFRGLGDTKNQLEQAALSISNNVAEGFERGTTKDLINFCILLVGRRVNLVRSYACVKAYLAFQISHLKFQI
jgi:hypothetical protein